ncbi:family 78 glycoside hydrolase catalytic domain [Chitinophaga arvensicola]|uniref:alpha-L-rhamnosidase n=1 Tax=Chitinophaga arvensicola TaxID=29529 RepID=A0A1I0SA68_9BACT|nr:family 78 glycoside hydrolase catalytic domain [Chitinophaga arvensicola]SEW53315.1 alpha-L-rhamnosidase [Chitinophaga arvensicola]
MKLSFLFILFCLPFLAIGQSSILVQNQRCEYLINPEGIDELSPRLSWTLGAVNAAAFGQRQTAYRIIVSCSEDKLAEGEGDIWDSGWTPSADMQHIVYKGQALVSDRYYYWKVMVKDEAGRKSAWSPVAYWSTGLLKHAEWTARWIGATEVLNPALADCNIADPWFRKTVTLEKQPRKAVMFIASVGYHELYVNGKKIGVNVLAPAVTDHTKRARYMAYDISRELKPGKNQIGIWLGASWSVFGAYATPDKPRAPIVIAQADVYNEINSKPVMRIQTDTSWKTHPSPNQLLGKWEFGNMGGEIWDAGKEITDWNGPTCDETDWKKATLYAPHLMLTSQMVEPNRLFTEIHPVAIEQRADGSYRVDMGVNFAGWTEIRLKGKPGQRIDMLFSEREKDDMTFRIRNAFIPGKSGEGVFKNRFNYSSGRWITIKGLTKKPELTDIRGWAIHTNYRPAASFECSDSLQNWIYNTLRWTMENISLGGYIVDCSSRERLGYGDADVFAETGLFNYHLEAMFTKWMEDWRDVQGARAMDPLNYGGNADDGIIPHTAPTYQGGGGPAWGGMCIMYPWLIYQHQGDTRILEKNFDTMKRWLKFLDGHTQKDNLMVRFGGAWDFLGDWLWPNANAEGMNNDKPENICFNNCYRVYNLRTAAKIARLLGRTAEALEWEQKAEASARAIHAKYYNATDHSYADSSMGNLAIALFAEIPPPALRETVMERLEKEILVVRKGHLHVGITAGGILFKVLRDAGRDDLLYSMTSQTEYPGWGYMKANGATSLWEMWEKDTPGHSLMHSSFLYPGAWYIDGIGGIRADPRFPGFQHFIIRPPKLHAPQMTWAKTTYESPVGKIETSWQRKNGDFNLLVTVPPGGKATVYFPSAGNGPVKVSSAFAKNKGTANGYTLFEVPAGVYVFSGRE